MNDQAKTQGLAAPGSRKRALRAAVAVRRLLATLACALGASGSAQGTPVSIPYEMGKRPVAIDAIGTLGADLFGDRVNHYNGAISFEQIDIDVPGNSRLPVSLIRSYSPRPWWGARGAAADWDLNTPRIEGTFSEQNGFVSAFGGGPGARCSNFYAPPGAWTYSPNGPVDFAEWDYWQGTNLVVPGHGSQELLSRNPAFARNPSSGGPYNIITRNLWQIGCTYLVNAPGQGFVAVSPEGVRYTFNWQAIRYQTSVRKGEAVLARRDWLIMATEVTDRFGNWVRYTYSPSNPLLLTRVESNDGRVITLTYASGRLATATEGTRTWQYTYTAQGDLQNVVRPDGSRWTFDLRPMVYTDHIVNEDYFDCDTPIGAPSGEYIGKMTHPSGATGTFKTHFQIQGRSAVQRACTYVPGTVHTNGAVYPRATYNQALTEKIISGPGLESLVWRYYMGTGYQGDWAPCTSCPSSKVTAVVEPSGKKTSYHYGIRWRENEGLLLRQEEGPENGPPLRTTEFRYRSHDGTQAYKSHFGTSVQFQSDHVSYKNMPLDQRTITQQTTTFTWRVEGAGEGFDELANPRRVYTGSTLGFWKILTTDRHHDWGVWVLGQVSSVTDHEGHVPTHVIYGANALPATLREFGREVQRYTDWWPDGNLKTVLDAVGRPTIFSNYVRGRPTHLRHRDNTEESAVIDGRGLKRSHTNEVQSTWSYDYDAADRLSLIRFPGGGHDIGATYEQVWALEYELPPGHWRQTVRQGHALTLRFFDALWRVRLLQTYDERDPANTSSVTVFRYDAGGRKVFESYPVRAVSSVNQFVHGTQWVYDALGRETLRAQNSELPAPNDWLRTTTNYTDGFSRSVTNPRGLVSTSGFQAYDTPSEDLLHYTAMPESTWLALRRDHYGKPRHIDRGDIVNGQWRMLLRRSYAYDAHQRLCKTIEPEIGSTVQDYHASGTVAWRASGLALPNTEACDHGGAPPGRKISYGYDARDRLTTTHYGDGSQNIGRGYTADGLLDWIETTGGQRNAIKWQYGYDARRSLTRERYTWGDPNHGWAFDWHRESHGHVSGLTDPWGYMSYAPDALGRPTEVGGYATGARYAANGALERYTLSNGISYMATFNTRGLPGELQHAGVSRDVYSYDPNGNVTGIEDLHGGHHRSMPWYDGLDRLRQANGPWGGGSFGYDALDNLTSSHVGGRQLTHRHDSRNRLEALEGSQNVGFSYDDNGNITNRAGVLTYFDIGNRLMWAPYRASYAYDGHGRRNLIWYQDGRYAHQAYTHDGKLRFSWKSGEWERRHVYLGDRLIAERRYDGQTEYVHTDALGSPVARTNNSGAVTERTRYEPYGATVAGSTNPNGIGFTGHVNDADTGLVYMQQRYYDPLAGRFLSVDPVITSHQNGGSFNRYVYALNNPLGFIDPTGMSAADPNCGSTGAGSCTSSGSYSGGLDSSSNERSLGAAVGNGLKVVGGAAAVALGAKACITGVGCAIGAPVALFGASEVTEGLTYFSNRTMHEGFNPIRDSLFRPAAAALSFSEASGDLAYNTASLLTVSASVVMPVKSFFWSSYGTASPMTRSAGFLQGTGARWNDAFGLLPLGPSRASMLTGVGAKGFALGNSANATFESLSCKPGTAGCQ